jgi:DNA processing protein
MILHTDPRFYWLALQAVHGLGPKVYLHLLEVFKHPQAAIEATDQQWHALGLNAVLRQELQLLQRNATRHTITQQVEKDLEWLDRHDGKLLTWNDPDYPILLKQLSVAPPLLYVLGDIETLNKTQLAIVGSRNASTSGLENAYRLAGQLCEHDFVVTSGLALGVDAAAHQGAIAAGGETIAVLGSGVDQIYPRRNQALARQIIEQGAIVSEFPLGSQPKRDHFPRRNRIISGMSTGVLVVEAALKSGSLITARYALEQNRDVFAIPGSINNPQAQGCHSLIKQGAKLVDSVEDICQDLNLWLAPHMQKGPEQSAFSFTADATPLGHESARKETQMPSSLIDLDNLSQAEQLLLKVLDYDPLPVDRLIELSELAAADVAGALITLELAGLADSGPMGYQRSIQRRSHHSDQGCIE